MRAPQEQPAADEQHAAGGGHERARQQRLGPRLLRLAHGVEAVLDAAVDRYVAEALTASPTAVARAKGLIQQVLGKLPGEVAGITAEAIAAQRVAAEGQEGLKAYLEKRAPAWTSTE